MSRPLILALLALTAACDLGAKKRELARVDSIRADSVATLRSEMLDEALASAQFVNELNAEMAKLKVRPPTGISPALSRESELSRVREERAAVTTRIRELVARLDSTEARLETLRTRAASFTTRDRQLTGQIAAYERTVADLRATVERQRAEFEAEAARYGAQIVALGSTVDSVTRDNVRLAGERAALTDTVGALTTEKNTAYYVIGTRRELVAQGILVEEGRRRLLVAGSRPVALARDLDPAHFTRIDRLAQREIILPDGEYTILTRHNPAFTTPTGTKDGRITGGLRIDDPERFWGASPFLVIVRH